jgi:anti-anti-sigma regulatory factor
MLRIQKSANGEVVFKVSGRIDSENAPELKILFKAEANGEKLPGVHPRLEHARAWL